MINPFIAIMASIVIVLLCLFLVLRPNWGLLLVIILAPLSSNRYSIDLGIQELDPVEIVFYLVLLGYIFRTIFFRQERKITISLSLLLLFIISFFSFINLEQIQNRNISYWLGFFNMFVFITIMRNMITAKNIRMLLLAYVLIGACYSLAELVSFLIVHKRVGFLTSSPNQFGEYLVSIVLIQLSLLLYERKNIKKRYLSMMLIIIILIVFSLTASRGSLIGLVFGLGLGLLTYKWHKIFIPLIIIIFSLMLGIGIYKRGGENYDKVIIERYDTTSLSGDQSIRTRKMLFNEGIRLFKMHPIIGNGPGAFMDIASYTSPTKANLLTHNAYLDILVSSGILGLFLLVLFIGKAFIKLWQARPPTLYLKALQKGLLASVFSVLVHLMFFNGSFQHQFWVLLVFCCSLIDLSKEQINVPSPQKEWISFIIEI